MIIVLDASAAVEIALNKDYAESFRKALDGADIVLAPNTFPAEITSVFWKYGLFSDFSTAKCQKGIDYCLDLVDDFIDTFGFCTEVFSESMRAKHSSYDLFYLIVARRNNAAILTRDIKMIAIAGQLGVKIATGIE